MPSTTDFKSGRFFHFIWVKKGTPLLHEAPTREVEEPFRVSSSTVFRLWPLRLAIVVGKWESNEVVDEEEALLAALDGAAGPPVLDRAGHIRPEWERDGHA